jgi:hypothetical protein
MFELYGLTYVLSKELEVDSDCDENEELVAPNWPEKSGFKEQAEQHGIVFLWAFPERLESYVSGGYEIIYETDRSNSLRKRFVLKDGSILVGKKVK